MCTCGCDNSEARGVEPERQRAGWISSQDADGRAGWLTSIPDQPGIPAQLCHGLCMIHHPWTPAYISEDEDES
jgi:hypothetical protein